MGGTHLGHSFLLLHCAVRQKMGVFMKRPDRMYALIFSRAYGVERGWGLGTGMGRDRIGDRDRDRDGTRIGTGKGQGHWGVPAHLEALQELAQVALQLRAIGDKHAVLV